MKFKRILRAEEIKAGKIYFETMQNNSPDTVKLRNVLGRKYKSCSKADYFHKRDIPQNRGLHDSMSFKYKRIRSTYEGIDHCFLSDCGVEYPEYKKYNNHKLYELIEGNIEEVYDMSIKDFEYWAEEQTMWNNLTIGW